MKIITGIEQGSDQWLALRLGKITASKAADARDTLKSGLPSKKQTDYAALVAVESLAGMSLEPTFETWQMRAGKEAEAAAREAYERDTGEMVDQVTAIVSDCGRFLYSPDGLVGDDGLLEVKALFSATRIISVLAQSNIEDFRDQCMFGLWLSGRQWIDVQLWAPAMENCNLHKHRVRIERDEKAINQLELEMHRFRMVVDKHIADLISHPLYKAPQA